MPPLLYMEPSLKEGLRGILTWFPTSALASLYLFSRSGGVSPLLLWQNLAVVLLTIGAIFALLVWQVAPLQQVDRRISDQAVGTCGRNVRL